MIKTSKIVKKWNFKTKLCFISRNVAILKLFQFHCVILKVFVRFYNLFWDSLWKSIFFSSYHNLWGKETSTIILWHQSTNFMYVYSIKNNMLVHRLHCKKHVTTTIYLARSILKLIQLSLETFHFMIIDITIRI